MENKIDCCSKKNKSGFQQGILYGILPHSFCIAFILLSIVGSTFLTTLLKPFLLNAYFFPLLIISSLVLATISAFIYLKKTGNLSLKAIANNKNYLITLYSSVIGINLLLFLVIFPLIANSDFLNSNKLTFSGKDLVSKTIIVDIPCSGHAPLIIGEIKKISGIASVIYIPFNKFKIKYDPQKISLEQILSLRIFESFKANLANEN